MPKIKDSIGSFQDSRITTLNFITIFADGACSILLAKR
jgi:hypothetical protein